KGSDNVFTIEFNDQFKVLQIQQVTQFESLETVGQPQYREENLYFSVKKNSDFEVINKLSLKDNKLMELTKENGRVLFPVLAKSGNLIDTSDVTEVFNLYHYKNNEGHQVSHTDSGLCGYCETKNTEYYSSYYTSNG